MTVDYTDRVLEEMPRGKAWPRQVGTWLWKLARGIAVELARVHTRGDDLLLEMDPRTCTETIDDWERILGLPDPEIDPPPSTLAERRALAYTRWIARGAEWGGSSRPFLISLLEALGFVEADVMFRIPAARPRVCGEAECGHQPTNAPGAVFFTEVIARSLSETGDSAAKRELRRYVLAAYQITDPDEYRAPTFAFPLGLYEDATIEGAAPATFTNPVTGGQTAVASGEIGTIWVDAANTEVALYPES
jgi:uncharacterized protein YmfQ (DUF2313 family)